MLTAISPLPHIRIPAPVDLVVDSVITNQDVEGFRKKCMVATRPIQQFKTFVLGRERKVSRMQCLVDQTR